VIETNGNKQKIGKCKLD